MFAETRTLPVPAGRNLPAIDSSELIAAPDAMAVMIRESIDRRISTSHRFARNENRCLDAAIRYATMSPEIAERCSYTLERKNRKTKEKTYIVGPSVRLAEIMASAWQNIEHGIESVIDGGTYVDVTAYCHDLESNNFNRSVIRRNIVSKEWGRYSDDMVTMTINAAGSIALRNAIFRVVPRAIVDFVYEKAVQAASGGAKSLAERRKNIIDRIQKRWHIELERIAMSMDRSSVMDLTDGDLNVLTGLCTAIAEGDRKVDDVFPPLPDDGGAPDDTRAPKQPATTSAAPEPEQSRPSASPAPTTTATSNSQEQEEEEPNRNDAFANAVFAGDTFALLDGKTANHRMYRVDEIKIERNGALGALCYFSDDGGAVWSQKRMFVSYDLLERNFEFYQEQAATDAQDEQDATPAADVVEVTSAEEATQAVALRESEETFVYSGDDHEKINVSVFRSEGDEGIGVVLEGPFGRAITSDKVGPLGGQMNKWLAEVARKLGCSILDEACKNLLTAGLPIDATREAIGAWTTKHGVKSWRDLDPQTRHAFRVISQSYCDARETALESGGRG